MPSSNLAKYIQENPGSRLVRDSLIACAASMADTNVEFPISIFFLPVNGASNFRYFETENIDVDNSDLANYEEMKLGTEPVFNGYLQRFPRSVISANTWGIVTNKREDGNIYISNPIRLKYNDLPTEHNSDLVTIHQSQPLSPLFTWEDGSIDENEIYFQVISQESGDLLSGTYTYERSFRFYDVSNVVLNIRDIEPIPMLETGKNYGFLLMAVSVDNWVNLVITKEFSTN
ncbi:MAG: hypothetical protein ACI85O_003053 [Saprospiraceae bacterium]